MLAIVMIGLPGSRKSALAGALLQEFPHLQVVCPDSIRAKMYGNEAVQGSWQEIWSEAAIQMREAHGQDRAILYDATNARAAHRVALLQEIISLGFSPVAGLWVTTPLQECVARNQRRLRKVPGSAILAMDKSLRQGLPVREEGFDSLRCVASAHLETLPVRAACQAICQAVLLELARQGHAQAAFAFA